MADTQETIADIIAEMRETKYGDAECVVKWCLTQWADRLEAAHKRERGDCAKLREALEMVRDAHYTKEVEGELCEGFEVEADDGTGRPLICVVEDALAEPPRNCDNLKTSWEVLKEWHGGLSTANDIVRLLDWLLSPATEKEGGAK